MREADTTNSKIEECMILKGGQKSIQRSAFYSGRIVSRGSAGVKDDYEVNCSLTKVSVSILNSLQASLCTVRLFRMFPRSLLRPEMSRLPIVLSCCKSQ